MIKFLALIIVAGTLGASVASHDLPFWASILWSGFVGLSTAIITYED